MVALSGMTGTAPSFFQVSWTEVVRNPVPPARFFAAVDPAAAAPLARPRPWFPHVNQWSLSL